VDLDALAHNLRLLKERARGAALLAVVKANGYGHGAVAVSRALLAAGADGLAVISLEEGEQLRRAGIQAPILVMGYTAPPQAPRIVELSLTPTLPSYQMALALSRWAGERGVVLPVHIKVDTGLNRFGLAPREAIALARALPQLRGLRLEGVYTHFAAAEEGANGLTQAQLREFLAVAQQLPAGLLKHVANTAALLTMPDTALDMVRPGLGLYGCFPAAGLSGSLPLRPALSLKSRVVRLLPLAPGQGVSYGHTWVAQRPSLLALISCGYADGLPRQLSNRGHVLIRGRRAPIVGRVCMDMALADVTDIPQVALGDEVVIIGRQGEEAIPVEEVAGLCDTISYEIFCHIGARVPRLYLREGRVVALESCWEGVQEVAAPSPSS